MYRTIDTDVFLRRYCLLLGVVFSDAGSGSVWCCVGGPLTEPERDKVIWKEWHSEALRPRRSSAANDMQRQYYETS